MRVSVEEKSPLEVQPQGYHLIAKSNALIYLSYRLSVVEQRIIGLLASQIHPTDHDFSEYFFRYEDLEALCGLSRGGNVVRDVKNAVASLRGRTLRLPSIDREGNPAELLVGWLSSALCSDGRQGGVALKFEPALKPYLLALRQRFTRYGLHNIIQMKSSYGIRFYEIFKSHQRQGSFVLPLEEARRVAGLTDAEHQRSTEFRRWVLEPSVREINKKTDIRVKLARILKNRRVVGWTVKIKTQRAKGFDKSGIPPAPIEAPPRLTASEADHLAELEAKYLNPSSSLTAEESADYSFLSLKQSRYEDFQEDTPNQPSLF